MSRARSSRALQNPGKDRDSASPNGAFRELRRFLWFGVPLVAVTLLVYAPTFRSEFLLLDDPIYVSGNPHVLTGLNSANCAWAFDAFHDGNWIPLTWLSLMLDSEFFGRGPAGYHVTNVVLHAVNTLLVFWFLARATGKLARSAFVAALFAWHPLHVESVAWIAERKDVLSILFGMLSLLAYVRYATLDRKRGLLLATSFVCFVLSLMSKQTLVTLPFLLLLLDFWPLGRLRSARLLAEKIPFFAAAAVFSAIVMLAQTQGHAARTLAKYPLSIRCANAVLAYATYLRQTFVPRDLAVYYPHPGDRFNGIAVAGAAVLLLAISAFAVARLRRLPYFFVGWAWFLGTLVPMLGLVQVGSQQMADRYTYFPLIGLFMAVTWLIAELAPAGVVRTRLLPAAAFASLAALAATTFVQVGYWQNGIVLFQHALASTNDNAFARDKLACALIQRGKLSASELAEAIGQLEAAIRLAPKWAQPQYNLALVLQNTGRLDEAAEHYRAALADDERSADAHNNLGSILYSRHQDREAKEHFARAVELNPDDALARMNLAMVCLRLGDDPGAIEASQQALQRNPNLLNCHYFMAMALRGQRRWDEAIEQWHKLLAAAPGDREALRELARTLEMKKDSSPK